MGQSISRRVVPRLNTAFKKYENAATKDALDDMAQRQALAKSGKTGGYSDPNAVHGGFRRENAPALPQEAAQEQFLRSQQPRQQEAEMPDDLLKFLNDNPLEKTVDRDLTSPKVLDSLLVEQEQGDSKERDAATASSKQRTPRTRTRRTMPLAESMIEDLPDDISADIAGATSVQRTTNFSTAETDGGGASDAESQQAELGRLLRFTDTDLATLLRKHGTTFASSDDSENLSSANTADDIAKQKRETAENVLTDRLAESSISAEKLLDNEKRNAHTSLLANALRYSGMPVLMKDMVDGDYVGVWTDRVKELERMKLRVVEKEESTLLFEGRAGKISTAESDAGGDEKTKAGSVVSAPLPFSNEAATLKGDTHPPGPADSTASPEPTTSTDKGEGDDDWRDQYMEEMKKIKGKVGSTGPATRKFLEEEAARAATAAAAAAKAKAGEEGSENKVR